MAAAPVDLGTFRRLARWLVIASVLVTVAGFYAFLNGRWVVGGVCVALGVLLLWYVQRLQIAAEAGSEDTLVFVTKEDCSLCEEAKTLLPGLTQGLPFKVEEARLETSRFLRRHFRSDVPVLLWQGEVLGKLGWDPAALRARLEQIVAARPRRESP